MRNNVPGGECVGESQPPGVEKAGGAAGDDLIESLRETIRLIERVPVSLTFPPALGSGPLPGPACSLSLPAPPEEEGLIPRARGSAVAAASSPPFHKIGAAGLHELKPAAYRDAPAALCFALAWAGMYPARASRQGFSLLWCLTDRGAREWGAPYGPGLLTLGLDPASVLIVKARNGLDAAWALEEGLKAQVFTAALAAVETQYVEEVPSDRVVYSAISGMLPWAFESGMGFERWVDYALDVPMYFVKRGDDYIDVSGSSFRAFFDGRNNRLPGERPTLSDWANHLSTIFPEVRLKRYLEMRGADGVPWERLPALPAFWVGLLYDDSCLDAAWDIAKNWTAQQRQALRDDVPKLGFKSRIGDRYLFEIARECVKIAHEGLRRRGHVDQFGRDESRYLEPLDRTIDCGRAPAEELLEKFGGPWKGSVEPAYGEYAF